LRRLYFHNNPRVKHERLRAFADSHFGPHRGYAQQFLFHWIRNDPTALPPEKVSAPRVRKNVGEKSQAKA
jgi:3-methyladenine DNA glycosylase/8-oxoguanine DNA glycosylase